MDDLLTAAPTRRHSLILVRNRAGVNLPFSVDVMAHSVLASGVAPALAYRVACLVEGHLRRGSETEFDAEDLAELAALVLATESGADGAEMADRYRAWRAVKRSGTPIVLCLAGAPGVGKSTAAARLGDRLGVRQIVQTDAVREVLRTVVPESIAPELHLSAHETIAGLAASPSCATLSPSFERQARTVTHAAASVAERAVAEGHNVLVEGAHLLPGLLRSELEERGCAGVVVEALFTLEDDRVHRSHMLRRARSEPSRPGARHLQNFAAVRSLQDELLCRARTAGVPWHDLASDEGLTGWVVDRVIAALEPRLSA